MSDHIAHLGICDDTFRLALLHPQMHPTFQEVMVRHRDIAHMGAVTRTADLWSAEVIDWARQQLALPQPDALAPQKLAFVLGSLTHRAADRLTKPITRCWGRGDDSGQAGDPANESKIMQDLLVFKEVYASGHGPMADPFTPGVLAGPQSEADARAEEVFRVLLRRALIAMHTIAPDSGDIHGWLTAFLKRLQTFPKSLHQYAQLAAEWDQAKVKKYLIDQNFHCRDDALIRCARHVQRGSTVRPEQVLEALAATDKTHSRYARALAKAMEYLLAAGRLLRGEIGVQEAKRLFDVGVPELSIQE